MQFRLIPKLGAFTKLIVLISFILLLSFRNYSLEAVKAATGLILDQYPSSTAAYSLQKLSSSYSGPAIRIRRDSDDAETDIGFQNNLLDTDSIQNFLGLNDSLPGDTAAFEVGLALRKINSSYLGPAIRIRRASDDAETDINFDSNGDLDWNSVDLFLNSNYSDTLPLDLTAASAAFSIRRLSSSYAGDALRVRRDNDNAELDIGFDENGDLDINSLQIFCAPNNCFVTTWYDQSGNLKDISQITTSNQAKIYDSLAGLITVNDRASMNFDGTDYFSAHANILDSSLNCSVFQFIQTLETTDAAGNVGSRVYTISIDSSPSVSYLSFGESGDKTAHSYRSSSGFVASHTSQFLNNKDVNLSSQFQNFAAGTIQIYGDGELVEDLSGITFASNAYTDSYFGVGAQPTGTRDFTGNISEIIFYSSDQTSNRNLIEGNIDKYFYHYADQGYIRTWYDQSGNLNHAEQSSQSLQARLNKFRKAIEFNGEVNYLSIASNSNFDSDIQSSFVVSESQKASGDAVAWRSSYGSGAGASSSRLTGLFISATNFAFHSRDGGGGYRGATSPRDTERHLFNGFWQADDTVNLYIDNAGVITTAGASASPSGHIHTRIGVNSIALDSYWDGFIEEVILYMNDQSSNRNTINGNINKYYKTHGNAYITDWYDQSGSGNDASQATPSMQPIIYKAAEGIIRDDNLNPVIEFDGIDDWLDITDNIFSFDNSSSFVLTKALDLRNSNGMVFSSKDPNSWHAPYYSDTGHFVYQLGPNMVSEVTSITEDLDFNFNLHSTLSTTNTITAYLNSNEISFDSHSISANLSGGLNIGSYDDGTSDHGHFQAQEIIIYDKDQSKSKERIEDNIGERYSLFDLPNPIENNDNSLRRRIIRTQKTQTKVIQKLDINENFVIDYRDLVTAMLKVNQAKALSTEALGLEQLASVDVDENNSFDQVDEQLIKEALVNNPNFDYIDGIIAITKTNKRAEVNFRAAKSFIKRYRRKKRQFKKLQLQGSLQTTKLPDSIEVYDCNNDNILSNADKICAIDFIREALNLKYSEKRVKKFLRKNKFVIN